jgi:hypothetical protein
MSRVRRALLTLAALATLTAVPAAARAADSDAVATDPAIAYLLNAVETSTLTFVRNGKTYDGPAAAKHMREKADYFRKKIHNAEDFIRLAGTKSELTGQPYFVDVRPGDRRRVEGWLRARLGEFRRKASAP